MGIRIQPKEIDVPVADPFENDLLGRKESIEALTRLLGSIEGPCVLAVDGGWGTGKTTFLSMWKQHMRNQGFPIVELNAWETDFSEDALVALTAELTDGLAQYIPENKIDINRIRNYAAKILVAMGSNAIKAATQGLVDPTNITTNSGREPDAESRMRRHRDAQEYITAFRKSLQHAASTLRQTTRDLPLVVAIDELDRCRPLYAIELLEIAKHLFAVDGIVFVLATNRPALAHSVKAVYGNEFDADGYLRRFFDIDFHLPEPKRLDFIRGLLLSTQIADYFLDSPPRGHIREGGFTEQFLVDSLSLPRLSMRDVAQSIHRFVLAFGLLPNHQRPTLSMAVLAFILRTVDTQLYYRFIRHTANDKEVVGVLSDIPGYEKQSAVIEALVIVAGHEDPYHIDPSPSSLLNEYLNIIHTAAPSDAVAEAYVSYAQAVVKQVKYYLDYDGPITRKAFEQAVDCLELVSENFNG